MTLPCRGDNSVTLRGEDGGVLSTFAGHSDTPLEFVWRTRGGQDAGSDDRDFQLVTWGKDRTLRLWPVASSTLQLAGHVRGSPIDVRMTRRSDLNVSYRAVASPATSPSVPSAMGMRLPQGTPTPVGPRLSARQTDLLSSSAPTGTGFVGPSTFGRHSPASENETSHSQGTPAPVPVTAPTSTRTSTAPPPASPFPQSGFMTRGTVQGRKMQQVDPLIWLDGVKRFDSPAAKSLEPDVAHRLGEEIGACGRKFTARLAFEHVNVAQRALTVSAHGPWSDRGTAFVRISFAFPRDYPRGRPPTITADRSPDVPVKQRARLLKGLRELAATRAAAGLASLDDCLSFILGDAAAVEEAVDSASSSSSSDEDEPAPIQHVPVLPGRQACVSFGPHDELVIVRSSDRRPRRRSSSPGKPSSTAGGDQRRVFESFGVLRSSPSAEQPPSDEDETESDEALRVSSVAISSRRGLTESALIAGRMIGSAARSRMVHIVRDADVVAPSVATIDALRSCDLSASGETIGRHFAKRASDPLSARLWLSLVGILAADTSSSRHALDGLLAQGVAMDMYVGALVCARLILS